MQDGNAKQQIVERIKGTTNILVTVNSNPTVDELSAALGFTLMLNKMDKHATAVFSGQMPAAIGFLNPDKTFENTVDSLRDFIIALDKEKADRLRYKVEDDVVRIFITPYKTTITDKDLQFSSGDFNVELIVALGVEKRDDLDKAVVAHGRILHDATVVTINAKNEQSSLGSIDWQDSNASSLCEMLMSLSEALQPNLLDEQISTALLTGIVAATERFSNLRTTPRVMTMSAQLMAAGANQQLIATKLEEKNVLPASSKDGATYLQEGASSRVQKEEQASAEPVTPAPEPRSNGEIQVEHPEETPPPLPELPPLPTYPEPAQDDESQEPAYDVERELSERLNAQMSKATYDTNVNQLGQDLAEEQKKAEQTAEPAPSIQLPEPQSDVVPPLPPSNNQSLKETGIIHDTKPAWMGPRIEPPALGSPLSATSQQALDDANSRQEEDRKHTLLNHDGKDSTAAAQSPTNSDFSLQFEEAPLPQSITEPEQKQPEAVVEAFTPPTLAELEAQAHAAAAEHEAQPSAQQSEPEHDVDQARRAVTEALGGTDFNPANNPLQSVGAQAFPAIEHEQAPASEPSMSAPSSDASELPPLPDFSQLPPLPEQAPHNDSPFIDPNTTPPEQAPSMPANATSAPTQANSDPGQFKIPGQ